MPQPYSVDLRQRVFAACETCGRTSHLDEAVLRELVDEQNDATLAEYAQRMAERTGRPYSVSMLWIKLSRAPAGRYERLTLLGAISLDGLRALMTVPEFTDRAVFCTFTEEVLLPALRPGRWSYWATCPPTGIWRWSRRFKRPDAGCSLFRATVRS